MQRCTSHLVVFPRPTAPATGAAAVQVHVVGSLAKPRPASITTTLAASTAEQRWAVRPALAFGWYAAAPCVGPSAGWARRDRPHACCSCDDSSAVSNVTKFAISHALTCAKHMCRESWTWRQRRPASWRAARMPRRVWIASKRRSCASLSCRLRASYVLPFTHRLLRQPLSGHIGEAGLQNC